MSNDKIDWNNNYRYALTISQLVRDFIAFLYTGKEDNYYHVVSNKKNKFFILCILTTAVFKIELRSLMSF